MARTAEGAALTRQHRTQQLALRASVLRDLALIWPTWEPGDVAGFADFLDLARVLIESRHADSSGLAAAYFRAFRAAEGVGGAATPRLAARLPFADIAASLRATGLAGTLRAMRAGQSPQAAARNGFVQASGSAARLVLAGGRDTVIASTRADRQATSWIRVTSGTPCAFCAMVASRGPEFGSERAAGFQAHDHCACQAEPYYRGSKLPPASERFAEQWTAAQRAARESGTASDGTKNDALNNFRRFLAGVQGGQ